MQIKSACMQTHKHNTQNTRAKKQSEANAKSPLCILFTNMMRDMCVKPLSVFSGHVLNSNCSNYVMN